MKAVRRKTALMCSVFLFLLCIGGALAPAGRAQAADTPIGYGTLDISSMGWTSYYMGSNSEMTGDAAGMITQGCALTIYRVVTNSKGNEIAYVYASGVGYGWVTKKYIRMSTSDPADLVCSVAQQQLSEYTATYGTSKIPRASNKYTNGLDYAWCTQFIMWCANAAGVPNTVIPYGSNGYYNGTNLRSVHTFVNYLTDHCSGVFYSIEEVGSGLGQYVPQPGDIIVYKTKYSSGAVQYDWAHVGLVTGVSGSTVTTIEGNTSNAAGVSPDCIAQKTRTYARQSAFATVDGISWYIKGYVHPNYQQSVSHGTLDISSKGWTSYYMGSNSEMTGDSAGMITQGCALTIYRVVTNSKGNKIAYVYANGVGYGWVTNAYIHYTD